VGGHRVVLHLDMNAFFVSVERLGNPHLRGRPAAVVGDASRRGIVLTASYEARAFGVKTAMLLAEARALCPGLRIVASNPDKYQDMSERIFEAVRPLSDRVEMTSCDEAYLDATHDAPDWSAAERAARDLQAKIRGELGLPCSVGAAPNKLLAKTASESKKPDGITVVRPEDAAGFLRDRPVRDICGVGARLEEQLAGLGVRTCGQLGAADEETLYARFGIWGHWLKRMGNGVDDSPVARLCDPESVKSVGHSTTFPRNTRDPEVLKGYLMWLCEKVARRLRAGGFAGRTVSLTVRYADFETVGRQAGLREAVNDEGAIYAACARLLEKPGPPPRAVRLLGVSVSSLEREPENRFLFDELGKRRRAAAAVDALNARFGQTAVGRARTKTAERAGVFKSAMPAFLRRRDAR
jgi:DNA polymerase IV